MASPHLKKLLDREMTRREFLWLSGLAVASLFGVLGTVHELLSHAATPGVSLEPEDGTLAGGATAINDSTASGGKAVKFSSTTGTGPATLPTGTGTYTYQQTGQSSVQAAYDWVAAKGGSALTFPAGTYPIVPDFSSSNNCPVQIPTGISTYGQGPGYTFFTLAGPLTIDNSRITGTNPYYIMRLEGGSNKTFQDFSLDGSITTSMPAYKGAWSAATTYIAGNLVTSANEVWRALASSKNSAPTVGNTWERIVFGGLRIHSHTNAQLTRLKIAGIYGYANVPPGEIFSLNLWNDTNPVCSDMEIDGGGTGAALFGANLGGGHVYTRCYAHNSAHSHGFAMYGVAGATFNQCRSLNNGGSGGSAGVGFNHEESTGPMVHNGSIASGNTLTASRFEAGDNLNGQNRTDHVLHGVTFTGSPYSIKCQNRQTSVPVYDGTSTLSGTMPSNAATHTVSPAPCIYAGA